MNLWCKDTTVCAINSIFSVDFYTFYWANVCTICPYQITIYTEDVSLHDHPKWYH